jgi:exopolysaccharide biosynthesis polyprenyl glycosylphosphotransferase
VASGGRKGIRSASTGGDGEVPSLGVGNPGDSVRSGEVAAEPPRRLLGSAGGRRASRFAAGLTWLFEGPGYMYVALTVDAALLLVALVVADALNPDPSYLPALLISPLTVVLLAARRMYDPRAQISRLDRIATVAGATAVAAVGVSGVIQLISPASTDSGLVALQLAFGAVLLVIWRAAFSTARVRARQAGLCGRLALIVGAGDVGARIERRLLELRQIGLVPIGFIDSDPLPADELHRRQANVLGRPDEFDSIIEDTGAQEVVFAFQADPDVTLRPLVRACEERGIGMAVVPRLFDDATNRMVLEHVGGIPVFELRRVDPRGWQFALKHGFDRVTASVLLVVLFPLLAVLGLAVLVSMGTPVLYRQARIGADGKIFDLLKFRSMRPPSEESETAMSLGDRAPGGVEGVDRRTPLGRVLRALSLDELPQLLNVARGDMSLVGPRPERPELAQEFDRRIRRYAERGRVRSGITGWAQVHGLRGADTSLEDRAEWDNWYIQNWSFWLDLKILLMTVPALIHRSE